MNAETTKSILESVKKYGLKQTLLAYTLLVVLPFAVPFAIGAIYVQKQLQEQQQFQEQIQKQLQEQQQSQQQQQETSAEAAVNIINNREQGFVAGSKNDRTIEPIDFNSNDWEINGQQWEEERDTHDKPTGYYCAKEQTPFEYAEMWFKEKIPVSVEFELRYKLKSKNPKVPVNPMLVYTYEKDRLFRVFFPDKDDKFVGIEDNAKNTKEDKFRHNRLPRSVSREEKATLVISTSVALPDRAIIEYAFKYMGLPLDGEDYQEQTEDRGNFVSIFPDVDPQNTKHQISFGTLSGACMQIISYRLIPK